MEKKKIKKKIWKLSLTLLLIYGIILVVNPTAWAALLVIIIPASILTVGIPAYAIMKHTHDSLENTYKNKSSLSKQSNKKTNQNKKIITNDNIKKDTDLIDDIVNDDKLMPKEKKQILETLKTEYEQNQQNKKNLQKSKETKTNNKEKKKKL